jgi:hypothetical protein
VASRETTRRNNRILTLKRVMERKIDMYDLTRGRLSSLPMLGRFLLLIVAQDIDFTMQTLQLLE